MRCHPTSPRVPWGGSPQHQDTKSSTSPLHFFGKTTWLIPFCTCIGFFVVFFGKGGLPSKCWIPIGTCLGHELQIFLKSIHSIWKVSFREIFLTNIYPNETMYSSNVQSTWGNVCSCLFIVFTFQPENKTWIKNTRRMLGRQNWLFWGTGPMLHRFKVVLLHWMVQWYKYSSTFPSTEILPPWHRSAWVWQTRREDVLHSGLMDDTRSLFTLHASWRPGKPLKTNTSPENWWLEDDSCPFKMVPFHKNASLFSGSKASNSFERPRSLGG